QAPPNQAQAAPNQAQAAPNQAQAPPNQAQAPPNQAQAPPNQAQAPPNQAQNAQSSTRVGEEAPNDLFLSVGKSVIVNSSLPVERVSVGFGDVAEATAMSPHEVLLNGKPPGETSLI